MKLVIIAGGKGTRLGLKDMPKPMADLDGKPLLEHQIILAKQYGIKDIIILAYYKADVISDYFGNGDKFGVNITHVVEEEPLGTAGGLLNIANLLDERFMLIYGDIVMDFDMKRFIEFDKLHNTLGTLIVHPNNHPYDSDLLEVNESNIITHFHSKPHDSNKYYTNLVNAAVYILSPKVLDYIVPNKNQDFGKDIFPKIVENGEKLRAYVTPEYIKDMGVPERFEKIKEDYKSGKVFRHNIKNPRPVVFLDRDGVINLDSKNMIRTPDDFQLLPNVADAIKLINNSDFLSIVVTNQPGIAKGFYTFDMLNEIHKKMYTMLGNERAYIDGLYFCPHHPESGFDGEVKELKIKCKCRKPEIGMFLEAQRDFNLDMKNSWMIGDNETDIIAGKNAGCKTILISVDGFNSKYADITTSNLLDAVRRILL